mgnify:CR=1 FL=1
MKIKAAENGPFLIEVAEAKIIRNGNEETLSQKVVVVSLQTNHFAMVLIKNVSSKGK